MDGYQRGYFGNEGLCTEKIAERIIDTDYTIHYDSPLGRIALGSDDKALLGLRFGDQKHFIDSLAKQYRVKELPVLEETKRWLDIYSSDGTPDFTPPLLVKCSDFRKSMWKIMLGILYGHTMTCSEIVDKIVKERGLENMSVQTASGVVEHNSIPLIIPCHRVVGSSGSLTGYADSANKKVQLLTLEKANMEHFFVPRKGAAL